MATVFAQGRSRAGLHRRGKRVYLIFEFADEYEAMRLFDVWKLDEVEFSFRGPKLISDEAPEFDYPPEEEHSENPVAQPRGKTRAALGKLYYWWVTACCRLS